MHNEIELTEEEKRQIKELHAAAVALLPVFLFAISAAAFISKSEEVIDRIEAKIKKG